MSGWQSFDIAGDAVAATVVEIVMKGTGSGAPGFKLLDARVMGDIVDNPTDTIYVSIQVECPDAARGLPSRMTGDETDPGSTFLIPWHRE